MKQNKIKIIIFLFIVSILFVFSEADASTLSGRILLQVEDKGQAYYVNPIDDNRYYLGRPQDAFNVMRDFGLGVTNYNIENFLTYKAPLNLSGRILLQVEDKGQAYYVNPLNLNLYYLGRPQDAFNVMRELGLGITNSDLETIPLAKTSLDYSDEVYEAVNLNNINSKVYNFKYKNIDRSITLNLQEDLYNKYANSPKVFTYPASSPPDNLQEEFYNMFLKSKIGDDSVKEIIAKLEKLAVNNGWQGDEMVELALSFVQYITYDKQKAQSSKIYLYYPYETLYLNKGVCSDTTVLAYNIIKELGYGVAIMDFPDINHSALGISCPQEYSIFNSGYCYAETTNYFPISVIPKNISSGQAEITTYNFKDIFSEDSLGTFEISNKTSGFVYQQVDDVREKVSKLDNLYTYISSNEPDNTSTYQEVEEYNSKVREFNKYLSEFYQL